ncbi:MULTISPECIES: ExbD/TolR family protein [Methylococcus]|jgi:biopolymer transport protein ExbD|uniref:Biopolymer transport protein, ExbD/TolR family n=2 Tax=Methylococcus capsulatus TaxID=414 RepID=Q60B50_METCA|nr:biopolymer transporter ExbD [Methylococcus capsulatus]AAU93072.1 biopolymer transport protein, ExbD/TolR family [Methylococcus capsulatus str. Bath]QXP88558.1 biopolymer transporter ExbD [Methylococcus capsulatus]QXP90077.1 biopolymer transporter ExbD [Methylococcus capsulatus]QXP94428.1 biopolymer transporter ExbD [Methylococcus capsulatus]UQN13610.1 biopolymer transporter ExbD [Methylococcus capsulatus]
MNFRPQNRDEPELNLIPMIDVLIVLMIFLVMTTTFSRETGLELRLPKAQAVPQEEVPKGVDVAVDAEGRFAVNGTPLQDNRLEALREAMKAAAGGQQDPLVIVRADRATQHQHVITVLEAAGQLGFGHIGFAAEAAPEGKP